jgi:crossover junction endodeoxyribonuclease RusA
VIRYTLPWPSPALSPNARSHWAAKAKAKAHYRDLCRLAVRAQGVLKIPPGKLTIDLEFVRPTRRSYDRDNLVARLKSGIDGMCDALKINDKTFTTLVSRVSEDETGGYVRVSIHGEG